MKPPLLLSVVLYAAYLLGLALLPLGVCVLCGFGFVASIRRRTSSSRF